MSTHVSVRWAVPVGQSRVFPRKHDVRKDAWHTSAVQGGHGPADAACPLQELTSCPHAPRSPQFAESWMGYSGPGHGILSLGVSEKHIWCLDYRGGLFCSALRGASAGLRWQKFEDAVQQVAVSPSGSPFFCLRLQGHRPGPRWRPCSPIPQTAPLPAPPLPASPPSPH